MRQTDYIPEDEEVIQMTRQHRELYPGGEELILMNREQARTLVEKAAGKRQITREELAMRLAHVLVPVGVGITWILGAAEGLADPLFAGITAAVCMLWAAVSAKWGDVNG